MEQNNPDSLFELQVDHESRNHFKETTKWTNFIAIIYFVCFGLLLLVLLLAGSMLTNYGTLSSDGSEYTTVPQQNATLQIILGIIMIALFIFGAVMLLRFSSSCRRGVETQDQVSFNFGIKALRNYFIAMGCAAGLGILEDVFTIIRSL
jgi:hypothetical protein